MRRRKPANVPRDTWRAVMGIALAVLLVVGGGLLVFDREAKAPAETVFRELTDAAGEVAAPAIDLTAVRASTQGDSIVLTADQRATTSWADVERLRYVLRFFEIGHDAQSPTRLVYASSEARGMPPSQWDVLSCDHEEVCFERLEPSAVTWTASTVTLTFDRAVFGRVGALRIEADATVDLARSSRSITDRAR